MMESSFSSVSLLPLFLVFSCISLLHGNTQAVAQTGDVAVNCGSKWNATALDGREWAGELASASISGQSASSVVSEKSLLGVDHVPYITSRISASPFHFVFLVSSGQKFIRFHFYPASYSGFANSFDLFTVKVGHFTLLNLFSATLATSRLGVKYLVKEFCLNVEKHGELRITFSPSKNHMGYAFVNGIEIISMPSGLYYTHDGDLGAPIVGQRSRYHGIDNSTALEIVQRLNVGGNFISSMEDFGMFRPWDADAAYFLASGASLMNYVAPKLAYTYMPLLIGIAPPKVYQTFWKTTETIGRNQLHRFTWKIPVNVGFGYFVRLHFCDLDAGTAESEQKEFSILINNKISEMRADVMRWSGGTGFPVYKDYVVFMKGDKEGAGYDLFITLQTPNGLSLGLLKGIEIFRLSNLENCLATSSSSPALSNKVPSNLTIRRLFSLFSRSQIIGTGITVTSLIVNTIVYCLRIIWEEKDCEENDAVEPLNRRFSLADIKSATHNFSDALVIGRGGFGEVYKGFISGFPEIVAIKRLSSFSRQGAREFWTEIETLSKLRHFNLVSLIGYCNENEEMILIYEYVPGGTLAENVYKFARKGKDCALLSWEQRLKICIGAARGLEYLHTGSETGIIHRDVKDTNILLDENFMPKISDVGLAKLEELTQSKSYISTKVKGTVGYLDPYYCMTHRLTRKSDVYSFGVVMLVVLSGRPAVDITDSGEPESLVARFQECLSGEEYERIVDSNIYYSISPESLKEFVRSVGNCLQQQPKNRLTMAQLVGSLELVLQLQENPSVSASGDEPLQHFELLSVLSDELSHGPVATIEESAVSPLGEDFTRKKASPTSRGDMPPNRIRKPFWNWPWKVAQSRETNAEAKAAKKEGPLKKAISGSHDGDGGLIVFEGSKLVFELEDLLTASAEVLGKGSCGTAYKATFCNGTSVAVKKLADIIVGKREFELLMNAVGSIHHENVLPLRGYYYSKEEKLIVYDYYSLGSVSALLHGNRGEKRFSLDWRTRVEIAIGAARGIAHLHECSGILIHGNIKSSNVFLNSQQYGCVSDVGLAAAATYPITKLFIRSAGHYLAPEAIETLKISQASDVYSFGVLLLELVTGKSPLSCSLGDEGIDLVRWVESVDREQWSAEVFDTQFSRHRIMEEKMVKMLEIGMNCVATSPVHRPKMMEAVKMLEDIRK